MNDEKAIALLKEFATLQQESNRITEVFTKELEDTVSDYSQEKLEKILENGETHNQKIGALHERMRACLEELERMENNGEI